jgi:SanA protein
VLVARGVPANVIYRDSAGFRTVTSVARARDIYQQKRLIIVSQRDHIDRAIFLARHMGVEAWGYDAVGSGPFMVVSNLRSKLTVIYAYWDLVTGPRPADGPRVAIGVDRPG